MVTCIAQRELRNNNADILNRVEAGENFVVTRNGVPVADVVPHARRQGPPRFPKTKDLVAQSSGTGGAAIDRQAWLDDIRGSDSVVDDDPSNSRA
jgi:prevent-host-death family protein